VRSTRVADDADQLQCGLLETDIADLGHLACAQKHNTASATLGTAVGFELREPVAHAIAGIDVELHRVLKGVTREPGLLRDAGRREQVPDPVRPDMNHSHPALPNQSPQEQIRQAKSNPEAARQRPLGLMLIGLNRGQQLMRVLVV
jgi:hypothetical protein